MVTLDQTTWNILFGWMTGNQCFVPEGCGPSVRGILVYLIILGALAAIAWRREVLREMVEDVVSELRG